MHPDSFKILALYKSFTYILLTWSVRHQVVTAAKSIQFKSITTLWSIDQIPINHKRESIK